MLSRRRSVESLINDTQGPFLEVGGPSQHLHGKPSINFKRIRKPLIVSNIQNEHVKEGLWRIPGLGIFYTGTERPRLGWLFRSLGTEIKQTRDGSPMEHPVDLYADARKLPIKTGALGALFAKSIHPEEFITQEAPRTLEPGGILVLENAGHDTTDQLSNRYFNVVRTRKVGEGIVDIALQRTAVPYEAPHAHATVTPSET